MEFLNLKTKRFNSFATAKANGLFEKPENFKMPLDVGLDLVNKRAVKATTLLKKFKDGELIASQIYLPGRILLPESKKLVVKSDKNEARKNKEVKTAEEKYFAEFENLPTVELGPVVKKNKSTKPIARKGYGGHKDDFSEDEYQNMINDLERINEITKRQYNHRVVTGKSVVTFTYWSIVTISYQNKKTKKFTEYSVIENKLLDLDLKDSKGEKVDIYEKMMKEVDFDMKKIDTNEGYDKKFLAITDVKIMSQQNVNIMMLMFMVIMFVIVMLMFMVMN